MQHYLTSGGIIKPNVHFPTISTWAHFNKEGQAVLLSGWVIPYVLNFVQWLKADNEGDLMVIKLLKQHNPNL